MYRCHQICEMEVSGQAQAQAGVLKVALHQQGLFRVQPRCCSGLAQVRGSPVACLTIPPEGMACNGTSFQDRPHKRIQLVKSVRPKPLKERTDPAVNGMLSEHRQ